LIQIVALCSKKCRYNCIFDIGAIGLVHLLLFLYVICQDVAKKLWSFLRKKEQYSLRDFKGLDIQDSLTVSGALLY